MVLGTRAGFPVATASELRTPLPDGLRALGLGVWGANNKLGTEEPVPVEGVLQRRRGTGEQGVGLAAGRAKTLWSPHFVHCNLISVFLLLIFSNSHLKQIS